MSSPVITAFQFDWTYPLALIWGGIILASLIGWGRAVGFWFVSSHDQDDFGWGSEAAWGMASFLVLSGPMLVLSIFSLLFVAFFLLAGLGLLAWHLHLNGGRRKPWVGPPTFGLKVLFVILGLLISLTYAGVVADHRYNDGDDFQAYFGFSKMALDMGTLSDPFNFRLLGSVGGQPILTTLVVAFLPWKYTNMLDAGIAGLILLGLTQELVRGDDKRAWSAHLLLVLLALIFAMPRDNTASEYTGTILFLAFFLWLERIDDGRSSGWKAAIMLGSLVTAASTLRCHNIFVMVALGAGFVLWRLAEEKQNRREIVYSALLTGVITVILLAPWWVVTYRSSGAFLYPLFSGTQRPVAEQFDYNLSPLGVFRYVEGFFFSGGSVSSPYLVLFWPVCLIHAGRRQRGLMILAASIVLISVLFVYRLAGSDYFDLNRYLDPVAFAFALFTSGIVARQLVDNPTVTGVRSFKWQTKLAAFSMIIALLLQGPSFFNRCLGGIAQIFFALDARREMTTDYFNAAAPIDEEKREYPKAFAQIPPGSKILIVLDYPFLLNYQTHTVYSVDLTGEASPAPGLPFFQGAEPVKHYLLSQGIHYIAHAPFDRSSYHLHSRKGEQAIVAGSLLLYKFYAEIDLNFFDNIDQLAKTNRILYDSPTIRVIDLGSP